MKPSPEILALRWKDTCAHYSPHEWVAARNVVTANKAALADYFYECMLADPNAAFFLSDQLVKTKLHASMQDWLESVYAAAPPRNTSGPWLSSARSAKCTRASTSRSTW